MALLVIIIWIGFCFLIGKFAKQRGRDGVAWGFLSAVISPLLAFIILAIMPDLEAEAQKETQQRLKEEKEKELKEEEKQKQIKEALKITGADFLISAEKLHQLFEKKILSPLEYNGRKLKLINDLSNRILAQSPEEFLSDIIPLMEQNVITQDEMQKVKEIVFNKVDSIK